MQTATVENGKGTASRFTHLTARAAEGKMLAEDLVEAGKRKAQRMVREGIDLGEESKRHINHNPRQSVGLPKGVGVGLEFGFLECLNMRH